MSLGLAFEYVKDLITGKQKVEDAPLLHPDKLADDVSQTAENIGKGTATIIYSTLDMLTGGGLSEAAEATDPDRFKVAEKLGLELRDLEQIRDRIATELNRLEVDLSQVEDPSAYLRNEVQNSLQNLGFVNSKRVVDLLNKRFNTRSSARDKEIDDIHQSYLKRRAEMSDQVNAKRKELDAKEAEVRSKQDAYEKELNRSNTKKVLDL